MFPSSNSFFFSCKQNRIFFPIPRFFEICCVEFACWIPESKATEHRQVEWDFSPLYISSDWGLYSVETWISTLLASANFVFLFLGKLSCKIKLCAKKGRMEVKKCKRRERWGRKFMFHKIFRLYSFLPAFFVTAD